MKPSSVLVPAAFLAVVAALLLPPAGFGRAAADRPGLAPAAEVLAHLEAARTAGLYRAPAEPVILPALARRVAVRPAEPVTVWVFFTDKGIGTPASLASGLARFRDGLGEPARQRRRALGAELGADFSDLPVHAAYVDRLREDGFAVRRVSRWLNAASLRADGARVADLARYGFVREVRPVLVKRKPVEPLVLVDEAAVTAAAEAPSDSVEALFYGPSMNQLDQIQVLDLHRLGYTGAGVRVMMIDTGYRKDHPAFDDLTVVAEWDFIQEDGNTQNEVGDISTQHNHGTGTWGVLGGHAPGALIGPAFAAEFVLAKTEDVPTETHAEEDNYVAALEWGDSLGVDVTSASLGYWDFDDSTAYTIADLDGDTAPITIAVDLAAAKGICCVNSAGNAGPAASTIGSPADADSVLSVGAVDSLDVLQYFSSRGPTGDGRIKPEICARGRSTYWAVAGNLGYGPANGTSLSCPLIGGLAALLKEAHPTWTGAEIREAVIGTGTQAGTPDNDLGYGIARGLDALTHGGATPSPPRTSLPFALLTPETGSVLNSVAPTLTWGASEDAFPGDVVTYSVVLGEDPGFTVFSTFDAGTDTSFHVPVALEPDSTYWWRVDATGTQGYARKSMNVHSFQVSATVAVGPSGDLPLPRLGAAVPNPMRSHAAISYRLEDGERAVLDVLTVTGRLVRRFDLAGRAGEGVVTWDGRDGAGRATPAGIYFYRLAGTRGGVETRKLVRLP